MNTITMHKGGLKMDDINTLICAGDYVLDRADNNCLRQVSGFIVHDPDNITVTMVDGGEMNLEEIKFDDIRLTSEIE